MGRCFVLFGLQGYFQLFFLCSCAQTGWRSSQANERQPLFNQPNRETSSVLKTVVRRVCFSLCPPCRFRVKLLEAWRAAEKAEGKGKTKGLKVSLTNFIHYRAGLFLASLCGYA